MEVNALGIPTGFMSEKKNIFLCRLSMANMPWGRAQCIPLFCDPGSERGTFQTRILERVAISSSGGIFLTQGSNPCLYTTPVASKCFPTAPPGNPWNKERNRCLWRFSTSKIKSQAGEQSSFSKATAFFPNWLCLNREMCRSRQDSNLRGETPMDF